MNNSVEQVNKQPDAYDALMASILEPTGVTSGEYDAAVEKLTAGFKQFIVDRYLENLKGVELTSAMLHEMLNRVNNLPTTIVSLALANAMVNHCWDHFAQMAKQAGLPNPGTLSETDIASFKEIFRLSNEMHAALEREQI